ncbi:CYFA0S13e03312g1_1 [Cyberlindnera fabianii]|uniref:CYFA0S13e03312g1_1 n=1 Tax=Cyberlindnera fabianii TaxID=36022 RepID=A0A061B879_CYBFA|nr:CYFA0S13e03312g1_1 [Cyberlindnera fabianii]
MYGGGQPLSEDEKKAHQAVTNQTLITAGYIAAALWVTPIIVHFVHKQFK